MGEKPVGIPRITTGFTLFSVVVSHSGRVMLAVESEFSCTSRGWAYARTSVKGKESTPSS